MITGAHVVLYSRDADADRAFLADVLGFPSVDAGHGWLIFALPPAELAAHPTGGDPSAELYLMCDDVEAEVRALEEKGVSCAEIEQAGWGSVTSIRLPSGAVLGLYQPRHASPR